MAEKEFQKVRTCRQCGEQLVALQNTPKFCYECGTENPYGAPSQLSLFGAPSTLLKAPVKCYDLSMTEKGSLLLATGEHGLMEYCTFGHKISSWMSLEKISDTLLLRLHADDPMKGDTDNWWVGLVEALDGGRAVVGVYQPKLLVLLRHCRDEETAIGSWVEVHRFDKLRGHPTSLSVRGDALAVAQQHERNQVDVLSLRSGERLDTKRLDYGILSVAITDKLIVTLSRSQVELVSGREAHVVDAHSRQNFQRLWRYEFATSEDPRDICADAANGVLYLSVVKPSGSRVLALSAESGRLIQHDALNSGHVAPEKLSLRVRGRVTDLAVLHSDSTTVTVHRRAHE